VSVIDIVFFVWTIVVVIALKLMYVTEDMDEKAQEPYSFDCVLYYFGAKHAPSIRYRYQFHRLLMPALLHGSPMHIIGNLVVQIYYGFTQEKYFGLKRVALVYILGALGGALFSCIFFKD
jgi:membrane associated rhomboid family serine protease